MALLVQKFGGTSVGSPERIRAVADRITQVRASGNSLVVVVSAMGHTTDELIQLAHQVAEHPSSREMDMLLTAGERISMALLCMALEERGVKAISFTGSQSGIITDPSHRRARIKRIQCNRVRSALDEGRVAIVAGFQGVSEAREITTLGRGGSDTTAVALAAVLEADSCEIFTDVDGLYSADPRWVPQAKLWREIPHSVLIEMTSRGAKVLHPRSVELAKRFGVSLKICNSFNESEGTRVISETHEGMEEFRVVGVASDSNRMLATIELSRPTVLGAVWDRAKAAHLSILAPLFAEGRAYFFVEKEAEEEWKENLQDLCTQGFLKSFQLDSSFIPLSVIGERFAQDGGALNQVMEVLARNHILVTLGSASPLAITVAVKGAFAEDGVKALHEAFLSN